MRKSIMVAVATTLAFGGMLTIDSSPGFAKKRPLQAPYFGYNRDFSYDITTKKPLEGYEGPAGPGLSGYCSYHKIPVRKCVAGKNGKQRCFAAAWTLHQFCNVDPVF